jgi:hypothetical protein
MFSMASSQCRFINSGVRCEKVVIRGTLYCREHLIHSLTRMADGRNLLATSVPTAEDPRLHPGEDDPNETAVRLLIEEPIPADQDTIRELCEAFTNGEAVRWLVGSPDSNIQDLSLRNRTITTVLTNYETYTVYGIKYSRILDSIWAKIRSHPRRNELVLRLVRTIVFRDKNISAHIRILDI